MTDAPLGILAVCIGNVCRSPLIERLLARDLADAPLTFEVSSAGIRAMVGESMEPHAADQLRALGGDPEGFVARQVQASMVRDAALVLVATENVRQRVLEEAPMGLRRTFTVREFAYLVEHEGIDAAESFEKLIADAARRRSTTAGKDLDLPDPMGRSVKVHQESARMAAEAVSVIVKRLSALTR